MKILAALLLSISLPGVHVAPAPRKPEPVQSPKAQNQHKGGVWYFAETGHAVYCYGPVMYVQDLQGGLTRVATFCRGEKTMVPLKD
jgi:hypothetical protein